MVKFLIVLTKSGNDYIVFVPDLNIGTQGKNLEDAKFMAKDAIEIWISCEKEAGRNIPTPVHTSWTKENEEDIMNNPD